MTSKSLTYSIFKFLRDSSSRCSCASNILLNALKIRHVQHPVFIRSYVQSSSGLSTSRESNSSSVNSDGIHYNRLVPVTPDEVKELRRSAKVFTQPNDSKVLRVAILGSPNAGKSTIINRIMGWRVCSVSKKVHTTRLNSSAICMQDSTQLVLIDTPGVVEMKRGRKHNLDLKMILQPEKCLAEVDLVAVVVDASNKYTCNSIDSQVLKLLKWHPDTDSVLILNKIDLLKSKTSLLDMTRLLTGGVVNGTSFQKLTPRKHQSSDPLPEEFLKTIGKPKAPVTPDTSKCWPHFKDTFMISAETGDGIIDFRNYLMSKAKTQPWVCNPSIVTNQSPFTLATMTVREKLLDYLPQEIPYNVNLKVLVWEVDEFDALQIVIQVIVPRQQIVKLIIGKNGKKVAKIADKASQDLANTFRRDVFVKLDVVCKVKK